MDGPSHPPPSLIQYAVPVPVNAPTLPSGRAVTASGDGAGMKGTMLSVSFAHSATTAGASASEAAPVATARVGTTDPADVVKILNAIIPPREWTESDGRLWHQFALSSPPTRDGVVALQSFLYDQLKARQARSSPLCAIREELFSQAFDEILRQVTLECLERGYLLMRIRDELRMTLAAYHSVYLGSVSYGLKNMSLTATGEAELVDAAAAATSTVKQLRAEVHELEALAQCTNDRFQTLRDSRNAEHAETVSFLKAQNKQLETFLKSAAAMKDGHHPA